MTRAKWPIRRKEDRKMAFLTFQSAKNGVMKKEEVAPINVKNLGIGSQMMVSNEYHELKTRMHNRLLDLIDLSLINGLDETRIKQEIRRLMEKLLQEDNGFPLNAAEEVFPGDPG
jgi:hypothetical protein